MPLQSLDIQPYDSLFTFQKELDKAIYLIKGFYRAHRKLNNNGPEKAKAKFGRKKMEGSTVA